MSDSRERTGAELELAAERMTRAVQSALDQFHNETGGLLVVTSLSIYPIETMGGHVRGYVVQPTIEMSKRRLPDVHAPFDRPGA